MLYNEIKKKKEDITMRRKLFFVLIVCLLGSFVSSAFAASTFKQVNVNPFYRPPLTSEADLKEMVKSQNTLIKTGFTKAGVPYLYRAFSEQFPGAAIDSIKVSPGDKFKWMFFRKKGAGPVIITKDVTWVGKGPLDAYRFYIDSKGKRYEFAVLTACGNFALKNVTNIPSAKTPDTSGKAATALSAPMPATSGKAATAIPTPMPGTADSGTAGATTPMPGTAGDRSQRSRPDARTAGVQPPGSARPIPAPGRAAAGPASRCPAPLSGSASDRSCGADARRLGKSSSWLAAPMPGTSESGRFCYDDVHRQIPRRSRSGHGLLLPI